MAFLFGFFAEIFNFLISFLLVFAIFYGMLSKTRVISERHSVNSLISFVIGIVFAFSGAFNYLVKVIPYFALLLVLVSAFFLILFLMGFKMDFFMKKENEKLTKFVVWTLVAISLVFVLFTAWNMYAQDVKAEIAFYALANASVEQSMLSGNLTGNIFHDAPLKYEYYCTMNGRYLAPVLFLGQGGILCLIMHPRVIGVVLLLPVLALIVYLFTRPKT